MRKATRIEKHDRTRELAKQGNIITPERAAVMDRARIRLMQGRAFSDNSADLIREGREERTDQI